MSTAVTETAGHGDADISPEHFIADHTLVYVIKGIMRCYDGHNICTFTSGSCALARKNRLARYQKEKEHNKLEKVFVFFDEKFLRMFYEKHKTNVSKYLLPDTFIKINTTGLLAAFIHSLLPYYKGGGRIESQFAEVKREELLLILLQQQPELAGVFFDFGKPEKINLEAFMNHNYTFNVGMERFAYLTGRSLSAFKRDFHAIFHETPGRWLVQKRLEEAHFLIEKKAQKPSDIFLDLGFETLSHFSFVFKKQFGITPTELIRRSEQAIN